MKLEYLAGLIDGEGSVGMFSKGSGQSRFVIEVKMTSKELLMEVQSAYGGSLRYRASQNPKWQDQWVWRIEYGKARALYDSLKPELRLK